MSMLSQIVAEKDVELTALDAQQGGIEAWFLWGLIVSVAGVGVRIGAPKKTREAIVLRTGAQRVKVRGANNHATDALFRCIQRALD